MAGCRPEFVVVVVEVTKNGKVVAFVVVDDAFVVDAVVVLLVADDDISLLSLGKFSPSVPDNPKAHVQNDDTQSTVGNVENC